MKKTAKAQVIPAMPAPVPAKKKTIAVPSAKVVSPKVIAAAAAAVAPAPAPEVKKPVAQPPKLESKPAVIKIKAQIDIGFGNELTIRGAGAGLSWEKGVPMNCVGNDLWSVTLVGASAPVTFKVLVNDLTWNAGEDYIAHPDAEVTIAPIF